MGWTIALTWHHCHNESKKRFQKTLICGECNNADGAVKRRFGLPSSWSFSPQEIAQFVKTFPHSGKTIINFEHALSLYKASIT
jgi:hypothetical protein